MFLSNLKSVLTAVFVFATICLVVLLFLGFDGRLFDFKSVLSFSQTNNYTQTRLHVGASGTNVSSSSSKTGGRCLKNYFEDVLLVITFHYPFYDTLPLILQNYKGAFPHIVVCGPELSSTYEVIKVDLGPGHYAFECLGKAIRANPGLKGYLYVNDDMIVNWWNFVKFDKNKVWMGAPIHFESCHIVGQRPLKKDWMWWEYTSGAEHCEKTHKQIKKLAEGRKFRGIDFKKLLSTFLQNGKNQIYCFKGWSDTFYVPGRFSKEFQYLSKMFFKNRVFLEIAVPTILSFLDLHENWQKDYGTYLPDQYGFVDFIKGEHPWREYSVDKTLFIHPVKFHASEATVNRRNLKNIVIAYGDTLLRC